MLTERDLSTAKGNNRAAAGGFALAAIIFLVCGALSSAVQAFLFPKVETRFWPLLVLWAATATAYFVGTWMLIRIRAGGAFAVFFVVSALVGIVLVGTVAYYVLTDAAGVSWMEYLALGAYAVFLGVAVFGALKELS